MKAIVLLTVLGLCFYAYFKVTKEDDNYLD